AILGAARADGRARRTLLGFGVAMAFTTLPTACARLAEVEEGLTRTTALVARATHEAPFALEGDLARAATRQVHGPGGFAGSRAHGAVRADAFSAAALVPFFENGKADPAVVLAVRTAREGFALRAEGARRPLLYRARLVFALRIRAPIDVVTVGVPIRLGATGDGVDADA